MGKKVACIIQARMGSSRLPGKIIKDLVGRPMLLHLVERVRQARRLDEVIVATSDGMSDDPVEKLLGENGIPCFRGDEDDVLSRYVGAARLADADVVVRITGDCPLIDPVTVDRVLEAHFNNSADYTSNTIERTYPRGLDAEAFSMDALLKADSLAAPGPYREHVTLYMYRHPEEFSLSNVAAEPPLDRPDLRLCVDTEEDFRLIKEIYEGLYQPGRIIDILDVISLFEQRPELARINAHIEQKKV